MKQNRGFLTVVSLFALGFAAGPVFAEEEIHWDDNAASQMATPTPSGQALVPMNTPLPDASPEPSKPMTSKDSGDDLVEAESTGPTPTATISADKPAPATPVPTEAAPAPTVVPTPPSVQGILKMKDVYALGMKYYKGEDYVKAIQYLKQALTFHDPYTPSFYYAEADAMLGVIYQFHIIHPDLAYQYYHEALKIDPTTEAAKKHIGEVTPEQN
jgi:tetratricopeptide (TPR) repeat protein